MLGLTLILSIYVIFNLLRKTEKLEESFTNNQEYIRIISKAISESNDKLKDLDQKGTFKSDDEIGWFFKNILYIQEILNQYNINEEEKNPPGARQIPYEPKHFTDGNFTYIPYNPEVGEEEKKAKNY